MQNKLNMMKEQTMNSEFIFCILMVGCVQECQVEDSGTESDDETDKEEGEDNESEEGDISKSHVSMISQC